MNGIERELVEELSCDELCALESRKKPLNRNMHKAIRDKRERTECYCNIL